MRKAEPGTITRRIDRRVRRAAFFDLVQSMSKRIDEQLPAIGIVEEIVLQIGIALDHPDVAQHFEQHPRRASRAALASQFLEQHPHRRAVQADDDLAIRERRVVVRDFAQPRGLKARILPSGNRFAKRIHRTDNIPDAAFALGERCAIRDASSTSSML